LLLEKPIVMGIINVTPDSFYSNSRKQAIDDVVDQAAQMLGAGATILDIGGQSTRPGSDTVSAEEESNRVTPAIEAIKAKFPQCFISVDTFFSSVAKAACNSGADMVNDVSGGLMDDDMLETVAQLGVPYICMHMKGKPKTMQENPSYENVTQEVLDFFIQQIERSRQAGIHDVIIDPGFGFGKNSQHNFALLKQLSVFNMLSKPILLGVSRKSTIYKTLGITADEALNGTTVLHTIGLLNGAHIIRAHDVKEAMEVVKLIEVYQQA